MRQRALKCQNRRLKRNYKVLQFRARRRDNIVKGITSIVNNAIRLVSVENQIRKALGN